MSYYVATNYAAIGDRDRAFAELENAYRARDWRLLYIKSDPFMYPLRHDSRNKEMIRRLNLPE